MYSSDVAIRVQNVCMRFELYDSPRDQLKQFILPRLRRVSRMKSRQYFREFWALRDVSFEIKKGESVGIVGRNGSGKSTLLQIIAGVLAPTSGSVTTNGRIAALLELGSGFNSDFTGRENVFMNGALLGLSENDIAERFDDIVAFADIGSFIDQPIKTYSSGMIMRLAFSVAISSDPDILIVDEALSVGDELFQRKCFSRIERIRASGAAILFVSHSASAVVELCDHAMLFDGGAKLLAGIPKDVVGWYQKLLYAPGGSAATVLAGISGGAVQAACARALEPQADDEGELLLGESRHPEFFDPALCPMSTIEYECAGARIVSPAVVSLTGERVNTLVGGRIYRYVYTAEFDEPATNVRFGLLIKTVSGLELGGGVSAPSLRAGLELVEAGASYAVEFKFRCALNPGVYFFNAGIIGTTSTGESYLHRVLDCACFRVLAQPESFSNGSVDFEITPEICRND